MRVPMLDLAAQHDELGEVLDAALSQVVRSAAFIGGTEVEAFEREFATYLGARHAVGVANGTDALELALNALGVGLGDTVLTVPYTFAATLEAILRVGATPLLVDIRDDDFTMNVDAVETLLQQRRVKAIIPVHLYGQPADMDRLIALARAHNAWIIEDAAQAHGARCTVAGHRRRVGAIGDAACFSFYPTKNLGAMGDGGAVVTNREEIAHKVRLLANHGDTGKYHHVIATGRNSRLDAMQAAVLRVKLGHLDRWNAARRATAARYRSLLRDLPIRLPIERPGTEAVYHQYTIRVAGRDRVRTELAEQKIDSAVHYPLALHQQEGFRQSDWAHGSFPVAQRCAGEVLCLPISPHLSDKASAYVAAALRRIVS